MKEAKQEALKIAEKYIAEHYAEFDMTDKKPILKDSGDYWEFTYELPDYMLGGSPVVVVDKQTRKVIRSFRTQ